jgi:hypothetical protein
MHPDNAQVASLGLPSAERKRLAPHVVAAFPLALLVAVASLGGVLIPSLYVRESANWAAQGVGQDWVDLLFAVPWLTASALVALRGSKRALFLLAGGLLYTFYEFVIYGMGLHFNALFLVYCAVLGVSFFALAGVAVQLSRENASAWYSRPVPIRAAGTFLIVIGALFAAAWLSDVVPAILLGTTPGSIVEAGTPTSPVYVIDLAVIIPLHIVAGMTLLRGRPLGYALAPIILGFDVLMALSIAGMMMVMELRGMEASRAVAGTMIVLSGTSGAVLIALLRRISPPPHNNSENVPASRMIRQRPRTQ